MKTAFQAARGSAQVQSYCIAMGSTLTESIRRPAPAETVSSRHRGWQARWPQFTWPVTFLVMIAVVIVIAVAHYSLIGHSHIERTVQAESDN